ncbi:microcystin degradation protein MlrC [Inquilinus ginsengisoli]|uniref:Microcystinase C n=1 Tax=Inquilinus ginsengisoli TaxID=363840 RepID=A0ABU1JIT3_9PROT|nr:M81 family metallopeptidase [Inquilinus ginsengisoli]MDR6288532.1 microcystin degradation protein MlrC [Inquilinus ginsengisoli]
MARIAVGGFQHETNSFAAVKADFTQFETADGWPGLSRGAALEPALAGINLPAAGFIDAAIAAGHTVAPLLWCSASPSAPVTNDAFERITTMLAADLRAAGPVDAVYLDLHGAMVTESIPDGEGEILARIRAVVGPDLPMVASLDLHANVTRRMVDLADILVPYRTYPHVDMAETGARAAALLDRMLAGWRPGKAFRQAEFLISLVAQCTLAAPARDLYALLADLEHRHGVSLGFSMGFPAADFADCGPSLVGYGADAAALAAATDELTAAIAAAEPDFVPVLLPPDAAVAEARRLAANARRPVVLADTQDNPGGGAESDGVVLLDALIRGDAQGAVLGVLADAATAAAAHAAGPGAVLDRGIGAGSAYGGQQPLQGRWTVEALGDGRFTGTGPFYGGNRMQLGPMALLRHPDGVRVVVSSRKQQAADQAMFRHLGVEPSAQKILALKSSVHFRADFGPIAEAVLVVEAPGPNLADPAAQPFTRLRDGVRLRPLGPVFRRG